MARRGVPFALRAFQWSEAADNSVYLFQDKTEWEKNLTKCWRDIERLFHKCWVDTVSKQLKYNDKNLIEKVIRALSLLEMLVEAKCPMVFK